jgi:uracil-DNA glycosylase family 4
MMPKLLFEEAQLAELQRPLEQAVPQWPDLASIQADVAKCIACPLHSTRTQTVFADGNPQARLMVIGEGPGQQEDESGLPFVGRAGQLLTKILASAGFNRPHDVYIANVVKCRPPENRKPNPAEMQSCVGYLKAQIELVKPDVIILAGATAVEGVLGVKQPISKLRGTWLNYPSRQGNIAVMPMFHPSYLLRNPSPNEGTPKWKTWQDMLAVKARLEG